MKKLYMILLAGLFVSVTACEDEEKFSITPSIGFLETSGSVAQAKDIEVKFYSNVKLEGQAQVTVQVSSLSNLKYDTAYTTTPAADASGMFTVTTDAETGEGKFTVSALETGVVENRDLTFKIISVSGGGVQPAQAVALNYTLTIQKYRLVEPVNLTFDFNTGINGFAERVAGTSGVAGPIWATLSGLGIDGSNCVEANAFAKTGTDCNTYLVISTPLNASDYSISAMVWSQFNGNGLIHFKYSTTYSGTGDPEAAGVTWTEITYDADGAPPSPANKAWKKVSGKIVSPSEKKIYIAVQYVGAGAGNASSWRVDDIKITNQ